MKYYESMLQERIGFDFYCDVANNIVKERKNKNWTQKELAKASGIKESRLANFETLRTRIGLSELESLAKALDVTVNNLIDAEMDCKGKECLYLVWVENTPSFKIYKKATSKRMAFLLFDKMLRESGVRYDSPRERAFVRLVGVPVSKEEVQDKFHAKKDEDYPLEAD